MTISFTQTPTQEEGRRVVRARWGLRGLRPMMVAAFVAFTGAWIASPLVALVLASRGEPAWVIGLLAASGWVASILASLFTATAIRLAGSPARVFRIGMGFCACVTAAFARAHALWEFVVLYPLFGAAISMAWTSADIGVIGLAPRETISRTVGVYQTVVMAAVCAGPVVLQLAGAGDARTAYVAAVLLGSGALLAFAVPAHAPWTRERAAAPLIPIVRPVMLFASLTGIAEATAVSVMPVQALHVLGLSVAQAAAIPGFSAAGGLLIQYPLGVLAERAGVPRLLLGGTVVAAAAAVAWPFLAGTYGGWAAMVAFGAGTGLFYTSATLLVTRAKLTDAGQARSLGLLNAGYLTGGAMGAGISGTVADALPGRFGLALALAAMVVLIAGAGFAAMRRIRVPIPEPVA